MRRVAVVVVQADHHSVRRAHHQAFQEAHHQHHLVTKLVVIRITQALLQKHMNQVAQVNQRRTHMLNDQRLVVQVRRLVQLRVQLIQPLVLLLHHNQVIHPLIAHHQTVVV